jgi:solute carrier family 25 aspartate/glutamate transporter 12/13
MVGASCVYPMDKVKTRIQSAKAVPGVQTNMLKDVAQTFIAIAKKEGFLGMYKGMAPQMVGIIPEKAIKITVNDFLKRTIRSTKSPEEAGKTLQQNAAAS